MNAITKQDSALLAVFGLAMVVFASYGCFTLYRDCAPPTLANLAAESGWLFWMGYVPMVGMYLLGLGMTLLGVIGGSKRP